MNLYNLTLIGLLTCLLLPWHYVNATSQITHPTSQRAQTAITRVTPQLEKALGEKQLALGNPVLMRIFKQENLLEVWVQNEEKFVHFKTYKICHFSGKLGPKLKEGDRQSPEGFYSVSARQLNPSSQFHLSFNLGYPNAYDRAHGRTGSALMVHGNCVSIGCYAMTDRQIEEIYTLADAALRKGQTSFQVQALPFRLTEGNLQKHQDSPWIDFWRNLKEGSDLFEQHRQPPKVSVNNKRYRFQL